MERRRLQFAVWMTVLALPILVIDNVPRASAQAEQGASTGAGADVDQRRLVALRVQQAASELDGDPRLLLALQAQRVAASAASSGAAPPAPVAVAPTAAPEPAAATPAPTTAEAPPPAEAAPAPPTASLAPSTTAAPTTTTAAPPPSTAPPAGRTETGDASWYNYREGSCAHRTLPFGTVVNVTNLGTGASTTCTVADRGPFVDGRVIDLNRDVYVRLADISTGVFRARITW